MHEKVEARCLHDKRILQPVTMHFKARFACFFAPCPRRRSRLRSMQRPAAFLRYPTTVPVPSLLTFLFGCAQALIAHCLVSGLSHGRKLWEKG